MILRTAVAYFLLLLITFPAGSVHAGQEDSLRAELAGARSDTQKLRIHFALLKAYRYGSSDTIVAEAEKAREVALRIGEPAGIGRTWSWEGWGEERRGNFERALAAFEKGYQLFGDAGESKKQLNCLINVSNIHNKMGQPEKAFSLLETAGKQAAERGDRRSEAMVINNIAILHAQRGEFYQADDFFRKSLGVFVEIADSFEVSNASNNLGNINVELRKYTDAISWYVRAARIDESLDNMRGLATGYHNISQIYKEIGDIDQALAYSASAFKVYEEMGHADGMVGSLNSTSAILRSNGDFELAYQGDLRALDTCRRHGIESERYGNTTLGLGIYWLHVGDAQKALEQLQNAERTYQRTGWTVNLSSLYLNIGDAKLSMEAFPEAKEYFQKGLERASQSGDKKTVMEGHRGLFRYYRNRGEERLALENLILAEAIEDSLYNLENTATIADIQASYDQEKRKRELAEEKQRADAFEFGQQLAESRTRLAIAVAVAVVLVLLGLFLWLRAKARHARMVLETKASQARENLRREQAEKEGLLTRLGEQALDIGKKTQLVQQMNEEVERLQKKYTELGPQEFIHLFKVVENNIRSEEDWGAFKKNFEKIHPTFFPNLLEKYPDLKPAEIRLVVLIRLGMNQKDIANILNIHTDSVKRARNRLRHKLNLNSEHNLRDFLSGF